MTRIARCMTHATIIMSFAVAVNAQDRNLAVVLSGKQPNAQPERATSYLNDVNVRAVRHYKTHFRHAEKESWSIEKEGYRVNFYLDDIHCLVDYSKKGYWLNTIRILGEEDMSQELRRDVKTTFLDYAIVTVTELEYGKILAYFVKLEDKTHLKTVRVINNEMVVVEEYLKSPVKR